MRKLTGSTIANVIVVVAIAIVPLLYGGLLTSAYQNPTNRVWTINAAVVNEDTPADVELANGAVEHFALGDELTKRLVDPPDGEDVGFTWHEMSAEEATAQMGQEKVRAILTIPTDFTRTTTVVGTRDVADAAKQTLELRTDDGINYLAGTLAKTVAITMEDQLTTQGAERYTDNMVMSIATIRAGMDEAQSGSAQVADGTKDLSAGLAQLDSGALSAASGARQLAQGASSAAQGASGAIHGADQIASGASALSSGATRLNGGIDMYTEGVDQAAAGAQRLADGATGLTALNAGVSAYTAGVDQLRAIVVTGSGQVPAVVTGAQRLSGGADQLVGDGTQAAPGLTALAAGLGHAGDLPSANPADNVTLVQGVRAYTAGVDQLSSGLNDPAAGEQLAQLSQGATTLSSGIRSYTQGVAQAQGACKGGQGALCAQLLDALVAQNPTLTAGADAVAGGVNQVAAQSQQAAAGAAQLSSASASLVGATEQAARGAQSALVGAEQLQTGAHQLQAGIGAASDVYNPDNGHGASVAGVLNSLSSQSGVLRGGAGQATALIGGSAQLSTGLGELSSKSPELNSGATDLSQGAQALSSGAGTLSVGLSELASGQTALAAKTGELADGLTTLSQGTASAARGSSALATGAAQLNDGLKNGVDQIPNYSSVDAAHIADVISKPVAVEAVRDHEVANNGAGFTPMFMSLALWVGGIAIFLVLPALDRRPGRAEKWWYAPLRPAATATLMGVFQAVLLMTVTNWLDDLDAANIGGLILLAIVASLTFVAINQACVAALAYRGRFVSIILLCLQITSMGATFPIETTPAFFQWIHPWLPMSYTQLAFRDMIAGAGADNALRKCLLVLLVYFIISLIVIFMAAFVRTGNRPLPKDNALLGDSLVADAEAKAAEARRYAAQVRAVQAGTNLTVHHGQTAGTRQEVGEDDEEDQHPSPHPQQAELLDEVAASQAN